MITAMATKKKKTKKKKIEKIFTILTTTVKLKVIYLSMPATAIATTATIPIATTRNESNRKYI